MGFWIEKADLSGNVLTLDWSPSYDLQGDSITYDIQISTKPEFTSSTIVANITGLTTTDYVYNWNLPTDFYYVRILARDSANPIEHWQVAFNEYLFNNHEYHGVMPLQETTPPIDPPTDPVVTPLCEMGSDPQTIRQGEGTALWWWSQYAATGSINNGIGNTTLPSEYKWIHPTQTTTYTMSIANASGGNSTCNTTIVVEGQTETNPPICEMGVDPQVIRQGQGTALWWWSDNVTTAKINNGIGSIGGTSDFKWLHPTQTTTYKMTGKNANGIETTCETTITVQ